MAEIELGILFKQCLSRRLPDEWSLATEIIAWEEALNTKKASIRWNFTVDDARIVFIDQYPTSLIPYHEILVFCARIFHHEGLKGFPWCSSVTFVVESFFVSACPS
jgi:hypothetical protein